MKRNIWSCCVVCFLSILSFSVVQARDASPKSAIVLAHFGTTVPSGLKAILNIEKKVRDAYPGTEVRTTFTSNIIRSVWQNRQQEEEKWLAQGIPADILYVKNVIATLGDLLEDGYTDIVVQPSHMFYMEQSYDLEQYINGLAGIRTMKRRWQPFDHLVMGRPALGRPGVEYPYHEDVDQACSTLAEDIDYARSRGAALVYMGHGNEHWSTGIYKEVENKLRQDYPNIDTYIGVVEGAPGQEEIVGRLVQDGVKKVVLKPFMIVAGDHATNDMAGEDSDSWASAIKEAGIEVEPVLKGLGENDSFADLFVQHIRDAASNAGIELK